MESHNVQSVDLLKLKELSEHHYQQICTCISKQMTNARLETLYSLEFRFLTMILENRRTWGSAGSALEPVLLISIIIMHFSLLDATFVLRFPLTTLNPDTLAIRLPGWIFPLSVSFIFFLSGSSLQARRSILYSPYEAPAPATIPNKAFIFPSFCNSPSSPIVK